MGLANVTAIVEAHHGAVGVTSQLGKGSRFFFSLLLSHDAQRLPLNCPAYARRAAGPSRGAATTRRAIRSNAEHAAAASRA